MGHISGGCVTDLKVGRSELTLQSLFQIGVEKVLVSAEGEKMTCDGYSRHHTNIRGETLNLVKDFAFKDRD